MANAFGNALGNAAIAGIEHENQVQANKQAANPQAPNAAAHASGASANQTIQLPDGDTVDANGNVYKDGVIVDHLGPAPGKDFQPGAFKYGDRTALVDLLSGKNPGTIFDTVGYNPVNFGFNAYSGFDLSTGGYNDPLANLFSDFSSGTTYDTAVFDPTAAPNIDLGHHIDNNAINASIAKSPITTAELNEAEANGLRVELLASGGEYDAKDGVIGVPADEANNPDEIVATIAHELGHAMWGDVTIPTFQVVDQIREDNLTQQEFVNQQLPLQLQNEGVATINNIAVAEQIWPNDPNVIADHVNGAGVNLPGADAVTNFAAGYNLFAVAPSMASLQQAASGIGLFYGQYESPANSPHETYAQYYTPYDQQTFTADQVNVASTAAQAARGRPNFERLYRHYLKLQNAYDAKYGTQDNGGGGT